MVEFDAVKFLRIDCCCFVRGREVSRRRCKRGEMSGSCGSALSISWAMDGVGKEVSLALSAGKVGEAGVVEEVGEGAFVVSGAGGL